MIRVTYTTEKELEALKYLSKCYDFALSLCISLAFNELDSSVIYLRERKDYRHELKRFVNNAIREADLKRAQINSIMASKGFFESYADRVIDLASKDVGSFRNSLQRVLEKENVAQPFFYAQIETTRCLLHSCVLDFKSIAEDARKKFGTDRSDVFLDFNISSVCHWFNKVTGILYKEVTGKYGDIRLTTPATSRMWNRIHKKIADGEYITECMRAAHDEHPEFMSNKIKVRDAE